MVERGEPDQVVLCDHPALGVPERSTAVAAAVAVVATRPRLDQQPQDWQHLLVKMVVGVQLVTHWHLVTIASRR